MIDDPTNPLCAKVSVAEFLDAYFQGKEVKVPSQAVIYNDLATLSNVLLSSNYASLRGTYQIRNVDSTKTTPSFMKITNSSTYTILDACDTSSCQSLVYQVDLALDNVWNKVMAFVTQQWYFKQYDTDIPWSPTDHFMHFTDLISTGRSAEAMDTSTYIRVILKSMIDHYAKVDGTHASTLTDALRTFYGDSNLASYFTFPFVDASNQQGYVVLNVPYVNACKDLDTTFQSKDAMADYLAQFYQDANLGSYRADDKSFKVMNPCSVLAIDPAISSVVVTINSGKDNYTTQYSMVKVHVKMSFMCMLRAFVDTDSSKYLNLYNLTLDQWNSVVVPGLPIPANSDPEYQMLPQGCGPNDDVCHCTYFSIIDSYECPGWGYYYCEYFPSCKCIVTRAVPEDLPIKARINNKFGLCFDLNCPATKRPTDCSDQCALAKEWFSNKNWAENFVNPEAVDIDLIEKTCNMSVPQFSFDSNAYFWTWQIVCGAVCMFLTVPILVGMESFVKEKFSLRFVHILSFLMLAAMAVIFGYALVGVQVCDDFGDNNQAKCMDRLTQTIKLNHADCDVNNPVFCQCSAKSDVKKTCYQLGFASCKCQNNQICMPNDGSADIVVPVKSNIRMLRWQLLYFCLGLYLLVACSMGVGLFFLTNKKGSVGYVPTISLATNVVLHLVVYVFLFALMVIFPVVWKYGREYDQSLEIDTTKQRQVCVPSKNV